MKVESQPKIKPKEVVIKSKMNNKNYKIILEQETDGDEPNSQDMHMDWEYFSIMHLDDRWGKVEVT